MPITRREALLSAGVLAAARRLPIAAGDPELKSPDSTGAAQSAPHDSAALGPQLASLSDFEAAAKLKIPHASWEFYNGSVADEITMRWNLEAYQRIRLKPRVLVDVSKLDTRVTLFGREHAFPIILAPTAYHKLACPEGELATVRAANATDTQMVLSTMSTTAVEEVSPVAKDPLWFQLYVQRDRGFTRELVQRAQNAGCKALCLTVDSAVIGARNREERAEFALPKGVELPHLRGMKINGVDAGTSSEGHRQMAGSVYSPMSDPSLSWKDIDWLLSFAKIPLLLKGVLNADDADRAAKNGVAGIIVSNHGGRNLDTVPATIDALPQVAEKISGRIPVIVDGGVRRGTDVLKALALGANAVQIGRPYLYGLGVAGEEGATRVISILQREFQLAMASTGRATIASIDRSVLWT